MVFINEVKYACDRCIRGHRVSGCSHTNATLKRIKRKGRPTGLCSACRVNKVKGQKSCDHSNSNHLSATHLNSKFDGGNTSQMSEPNSPIHGSVGAFPVSGNSPLRSPGARDQYSLLNELSSEQQLPEEITPEALKILSRENSNITVQLPDGSYFDGDKPVRNLLPGQTGVASKPPPPPSPHNGNFVNGTLTDASMYPYYQGYPYNAPPGVLGTSPSPSPLPYSNTKVDEAALSNSMPHEFNHLNVITQGANPQSQEDIYNPSSHTIAHQQYMVNGPYNAALYNDSMGNNAASAAINLHGTGNYIGEGNSVSYHGRPHNFHDGSTPLLNSHLNGYPSANPGGLQQSSTFASHYSNPNGNIYQPTASREQYSYSNNYGYPNNSQQLPNISYDYNGGPPFMNNPTGGLSTPEQVSRTPTPNFPAPNVTSDTPQKVAIHNDLFSTKQELANSLPGIAQINPQAIPSVSKETEAAVKNDEAEEAYAASSLPQLSNLY